MFSISNHQKALHVYVLAFILSFCSFLYELSIAKTMGQLMGDIIFWQCVCIACYIAGLGIGGFLYDRRTYKNIKKQLIKVEYILTIMGASVIILLYIGHILYRINFHNNLEWLYLNSEAKLYTYQFIVEAKFFPKLWFSIFALLITLSIGILSGFEIPLLIAMNKEIEKKSNSSIVLGISYIGTLVASIVFVFLLFRFNNAKSGLFAASFNFSILLFLLIKFGKIRLGQNLLKIVFSGALIASLWTYAERIYQINRQIFFYYDTRYFNDMISFNNFTKYLSNLPKIEIKRTLYQEICFVKFPFFDKSNQIQLFIDGHFQFNSDNEKSYHEAMTRIPLALAKIKPKKVLVLGGGDGLLIRDLLGLLPQKTHIEHVELDEKMIYFSKHHKRLSLLNEGALSDRRVNAVIGDAFTYVRNSRQIFDVIFIDFPYPHSFDLVKLYSKEFFHNIYRLLNNQGIAVMDIPLHRKDKAKDKRLPHLVNNIVFSTLKAAGFAHWIPYELGQETFILFSKTAIDRQRFSKSSNNISGFKNFSKADVNGINKQEYPFSFDEKKVNSIFRPTLLHYENLLF